MNPIAQKRKEVMESLSNREFERVMVKLAENIHNGQYGIMENGVWFSNRDFIEETIRRFMLLSATEPKDSKTHNGKDLSVEPLTDIELISTVRNNRFNSEDAPAYLMMFCDRLETAGQLNHVYSQIEENDKEKIEALEKLVIKTLLEAN